MLRRENRRTPFRAALHAMPRAVLAFPPRLRLGFSFGLLLSLLFGAGANPARADTVFESTSILPVLGAIDALNAPDSGSRSCGSADGKAPPFSPTECYRSICAGQRPDPELKDCFPGKRGYDPSRADPALQKEADARIDRALDRSFEGMRLALKAMKPAERASASAVIEANADRMRAEARRSCRESYATGIATAMDPACVPKVKDRLAREKTRFLRFLRGDLPDNGILAMLAKMSVLGKVEDAAILPPPTAAEFHAAFLEKIRRSALDPSGYVALDTLTRYCAQTVPQDWDDAYFLDDGSIRLSSTAIESGFLESVADHEFGHAFSRALDGTLMTPDLAKKLSQTRDCLARQHLAIEGPQGARDHFEEDFGDLVAGLLDSERGNSMCPFAYQDARGNWSLANADESDPHASTFFRLLHIEYLRKGKLPPACEAMPGLKGREVFRKCW